MIRYQVNAIGGEIVGEEYLLLGSTEVKGIVQKIIEAKPDVIINTIKDIAEIIKDTFRESDVIARLGGG